VNKNSIFLTFAKHLLSHQMTLSHTMTFIKD